MKPEMLSHELDAWESKLVDVMREFERLELTRTVVALQTAHRVLLDERLEKGK